MEQGQVRSTLAGTPQEGDLTSFVAFTCMCWIGCGVACAHLGTLGEIRR